MQGCGKCGLQMTEEEFQHHEPLYDEIRNGKVIANGERRMRNTLKNSTAMIAPDLLAQMRRKLSTP